MTWVAYGYATAATTTIAATMPKSRNYRAEIMLS